MITNQIDVKDENIISWCDINKYLFWTIKIRNVWVSGYVAGVPIVFSIEYTFKRTFFKKTSKHICERASIVVERLENFLPFSMTSVVIFGVVKKKLFTGQ